MSCSVHQLSCTHNIQQQGDFSSTAPAGSLAPVPPGCSLVRCRVCSLEYCGRQGAGPASSPTPITSEPALPTAICGEEEGEEEGEEGISLLPTPPHGRQVAGPALFCSHPRGQLICKQNSSPVLPGCRHGATLLLSGLWSHLSYDAQVRGGASSAQSSLALLRVSIVLS